jgi:hypothetical protein
VFYLKRIAVQQGLNSIISGLESRGYEVVAFEDRGYIDAVVYVDDYTGLKNVNSMGEVNNNGALLINAKNKTLDQIIYIIETRRYEGLFT